MQLIFAQTKLLSFIKQSDFNNMNKGNITNSNLLLGTINFITMQTFWEIVNLKDLKRSFSDLVDQKQN